MTPERTITDALPSLVTVSCFPDNTKKSDLDDCSPTSSVFTEMKTANFLTRETTSPRQLSTARLLIVHIGAAMALFLATTDATIVSTSLPTIVNELHATQTQYTWVGVAYLLTQTAFQPLYGRLSDLVGRKPILYGSITIFALGSLLCGVAQNIIWLISARALAGIGGGGIVSSVWVVTSEIVEVAHRAKWSQALSITWCCSAIAGPLLGGLFSGQHNGLSWRWAFYLNLPICLIALMILLCALHSVDFPRLVSWHTFAQRFDFGGLLLFMFGSGFIIAGFSFATVNTWASPSTLCFIIFGFIILVCGVWYEKKTARDCLFPETTFKDLTTVMILLISFLHNFAFNAGTFYLAIYYQAANGSTPFHAGIKMLPYSLGSSLASMPAAWFINIWQLKTGDTSGQNLIITIGLLLSTLGFGLLMLLNEHAKMYTQVVFPVIAGVGIGMVFHAPYQVFTRALKPHEIATGTSAFFLVRFTGATMGLAVAGTVFSAKVTAQLPQDVSSQILQSVIPYSDLRMLQPTSLGNHVLHAVSQAVQTVWIVCSPCLGLASIMSLLIRRMAIDASADDKSIDSARTTSKDQA
ncbi:hypothetical protein APHAL10511_006504 [Amanita phalloides]|nr:hypothetical protein APHAL10511_006504 [Amanita phalloides]